MNEPLALKSRSARLLFGCLGWLCSLYRFESFVKFFKIGSCGLPTPFTAIQAFEPDWFFACCKPGMARGAFGI
jgi:hypothetical protein